MNSTKVYRVNAPQVISENIDGEVVLINLRSGIYYSTDRVGADLWAFLGSGISGEDLLKTAVQSYAGERSEIEGTLGEFISKLEEEQLIVEAPEMESQCPEVSPPLNGNKLPPFEKPVIEKYNDMKDLLLLDPIHDVDETGWPAPAPKPSK